MLVLWFLDLFILVIIYWLNFFDIDIEVMIINENSYKRLVECIKGGIDC